MSFDTVGGDCYAVEKLLKFSNDIRLPDDLTILEVGFTPT